MSREWTSANLEDARIEGMTRGVGFARMRRLEHVVWGISDETCVNGHPLSEMRYPSIWSARKYRWCGACRREQQRRWYAHKKRRKET